MRRLDNSRTTHDEVIIIPKAVWAKARQDYQGLGVCRTDTVAVVIGSPKPGRNPNSDEMSAPPRSKPRSVQIFDSFENRMSYRRGLELISRAFLQCVRVL
jgi:hypothetical protein